jgi:aminocarboxymuconate-semialdehyde decarboxylase
VVNRRDFFRSLAATTVFGATRPAAAAPRRQVTVGGRRVRTVDFHAHCFVPEAAELIGRKTLPSDPALIGPDRIRQMDEQGVDVEALSINPYWYSAARELAARVVKIQNEKLAQLCADSAGRFVAFATVALQYPDLAANQLEEAVTRLGLRGASLGATINGEELSSPGFDPFWAKAQDLGVPIFIHPQGVPELQQRLRGNGFLSNVIGNPLETTIALSHLIFEGTLDRFPGLKICAAHGGGYLPSYAARSDHGCSVFPNNCAKASPRKHPTEYLRQLYFDSLVFTPEGLRHLVAECGAYQIVMGSDHPYPWNPSPVDHILNTPGLSDTDREAILGGTACKLLGIAPV